MTILGAATLLVVVLGFMLFPLWPHVIRSKASWVLNIVMYLAIGMIGFLIALSIVRMIVYLITYFTVKPGIWIFPNLWEDVGIIESFIPLWDWDKPPASRPSRSSQATASTAESTDAPKESNN